MREFVKNILQKKEELLPFVMLAWLFADMIRSLRHSLRFPNCWLGSCKLSSAVTAETYTVFISSG